MRTLPLLIVLACAGSGLVGCASDIEPSSDASEDALTLGDRLHLENGGEVVVYADTAVFASAAFYRNRKNGNGCRTRNVSLGCMVSACGPTQSNDTANAGAITISGGQSPISLDLVPGTDSYAPFFDGGAFGIAPGARLTVQAQGGSIPAFTSNLLAAGVIALQTPTLTTIRGDGAPTPRLNVDRTKDLPFAWIGLSRGWVAVALTAAEGVDVAIPDSPASYFQATSSTTVECVFPANAGRAVIPAQALAWFAPGSETGPAGPSSSTPRRVHTLTVNAEERDSRVVHTSNGLGVVDVRAVGRQLSTDAVTFR